MQTGEVLLTVLVVQLRKVLIDQPLPNVSLVRNLVLIYLVQQTNNNIPATGSSNKIYALAISFFLELAQLIDMSVYILVMINLSMHQQVVVSPFLQ